MYKKTLPNPSSMLPLLWGTLVSFGLLAVRFLLSSDDFYTFLPYNLVLAFIPFILSWIIVLYSRHAYYSPLLLAAAGFVWLIFFPNAPYIVTDFIHLAQRNNIAIWFDALLILSFASTGLLAGWYSLFIMQNLVTKRFDKTIGWIFVATVLTLTSFGVYLGRFLRWNSWDIFIDPVRLTNDMLVRIAVPSLHVKFWIVAGLFLGFFIISYASLYSFLTKKRD